MCCSNCCLFWHHRRCVYSLNLFLSFELISLWYTNSFLQFHLNCHRWLHGETAIFYLTKNTWISLIPSDFSLLFERSDGTFSIADTCHLSILFASQPGSKWRVIAKLSRPFSGRARQNSFHPANFSIIPPKNRPFHRHTGALQHDWIATDIKEDTFFHRHSRHSSW